MTLTVGRASLTGESFSLRQSGNTLSLGGLEACDSWDELRALRQQLLGLVDNPDEPVVPLTSTGDDHLDGFYRVRDASTEVGPGGSGLCQLSWRLDVERVSDYAAPLVESILLGPTIRDNDLGLTTLTVGAAIDHHWALPDSISLPSSAGESPESYPTADGVDVSVLSNDDFADAVASYLIGPDDWYDASARLLFDYANDGTFRPVVGRQVINLVDGGRFYLSNGRTRLTLGSGDDFEMLVSVWDGSDWTTDKEFVLIIGPSSPPAEAEAPSVLTVLRNAPEAVTIRLSHLENVDAGGSTHTTITLRRGLHMFDLTAVLFSGLTRAWEFARSSTEAADDLDISSVTTKNVGIVAADPDAEDVSYVIVTPQSFTPDKTNGAVTSGSEVISRFGFGLIHDETPNPVLSAEEYFFPLSETVRVVER